LGIVIEIFRIITNRECMDLSTKRILVWKLECQIIQQTRVDHTFVFKLLNLDPKARPAMFPPLHEVKYYPTIK
jgi:hypothetical protein